MGGNAIKKYIPEEQIVRLNRQKYRQLIETIVGDPFFTRSPVPYVLMPTIYAAEKSSFGDLDLLFKDPGMHEWEKFLKYDASILKAEARVKNGDVTSYAVNLKTMFGSIYDTVWGGKYFQVDIIKVSEQKFENAVFYTSFGDVGHIIGMLFNRCGFKYGSGGLSYIAHIEIPDGGVSEANYKITDDLVTILKFLHLGDTSSNHLAEWHRVAGLGQAESENHVWEWLVNLPLFRAQFLRFVHKEFTGDRPTFDRFLQYVRSKTMVMLINDDVSKILYDLAVETRPLLPTEIKLATQQAIDNAYIKKIFNGDIVRGITGLDGPELGKAIATFKSSQQDDWGNNWAEWAKTQNAEGMHQAITEWYTQVYNKP